MLTEEHRNVMVVGDQDQCLVEGTRITMGDGTTRAIEDVRVGDEVLSCYGSGDFRPAKVARTHRALADRGVAITTASGRRIVSTEDHVHFAGAVRESDEVRCHRELSVVLCDEVVGATPMHRVSFPDWGLDVSTAEMTVVDDIVRGISSIVDVSVHPVARLGDLPLPFLPASSVRRGMVMVDEQGQFDVAHIPRAIFRLRHRHR